MMSKDVFSAAFVTAYLVIYCELLQFESTKGIAILMFLLSPFLVVWMVYTVLKHGRYDGKELGDEEFGYQDMDTEELKRF
ncbi:MAG: hypothetical protein U0X91_17945 [Spirosomataceae bacterium]